MAAACVGRDDELSELSRRCAETATTGADVIAVVGPPGIGKSALLRELASSDRALWAQAAPWDSGDEMAVLRQLVQSDVPADRNAAAETLAAHLGGEPHFLIVDDSDHADPMSLQAIASLVRHHRQLPVLVVLGMTASGSASGAQFATTQLRLEGIDAEAVSTLAARRGRALHPAMVDELTRHTAGNPRDVIALLDEVPAAVWAQPEVRLPAPRRVVEEVGDRLQCCGPDGQALMKALAVLEDDATLDEVAQLAELDNPLTAIDAAAAAGLVMTSSGHQVRLRDPLTRAAMLEIMGANAAAEVHRRAAKIVADPARQLRHRVAATPTADPALADEVDRLALTRGAEGAWAQAAGLFREASRLTADPLLRDDRLTKSVDALVAAGDCLSAASMIPAIESLRETPLRNAVLGYLAILRGRAAESEIRLGRAWDIVNVKREPEVAALISQRYVLHSLVRGQGKQIVEWAQRAVELAGEDSSAGIEALAIRGLGFAMEGNPVAASEAYDSLVQRVKQGPQTQRVTMGHGWLQLSQDDIDAARGNLETAVATAKLGGSSRITLWALAWLARTYFLTGEWDRALGAVEHGRRLAASSGIVLQIPLLEWTAAHVHALRGSWVDAAAAANRAEAITGDCEMMRIPAALARAQIGEAEADYAKVRRVLEPLRRMQQQGVALAEPSFWPWADVLGNALVVEGALQEADEFLKPHEARAKAQGRRSTSARLGMVRGRMYGAVGDIDSARTSFEAALELLDGLPLRVDTARVNYVYGQTLRRAGKRRQADAVLGTARDLYLALGATNYVERCERELKAGGVNPMRAPQGAVELTPQEEAVTNLVARGMSNREVAAELYVSTKTVQYHLTRVYAKLGVRSRAELAAVRR